MPKTVKRKKSAKTKRKYKTRKPSKKLNRKQLKRKIVKKKSSKKSKKQQKGGFKECQDCDLKNSFKNYMSELKTSLNYSKINGGGYSVTPDNTVGNLPVIKAYDDHNPPRLVNKKLINSKH